MSEEAKNRPAPEEIETLRALLIHGTVEHAAQALHVSPHTVDGRLDRLREKSGRHRTAQIVYWAVEHGYLRFEHAADLTPGGD